MQDRIFKIQKSYKIQDMDVNKNQRSITLVFSHGDIVDTDNEIITTEALHNTINMQKGACIPANIDHDMTRLWGYSKDALWKMDGQALVGDVLANPDETGDIALEDASSGKRGFGSIEATGYGGSKYRQGGQIITKYNKIKLTGIALVANPANKKAVVRAIKKSENIVDEIETKLQWKEYIADELLKGDELLKNAKDKDEYLNNLWKITCDVNSQDAFQLIMKSQGFNIEDELVYDLYKTAHKIKQDKLEAQASSQTTAHANDNNFGLTEEMIKKLNATASIFNNK